MPIDYNDYPPTWTQTSHWIRHTRAQLRCECTGQCGLHTNRRCDETHDSPAHHARGRIWLTTAHLCTCQPLCDNKAHLIAACQRCHLRIDAHQHRQSRLRNRHNPNQLSLQIGQTTD